MKIFEDKLFLCTYLDELRGKGDTIALVATMGALHEGHISLVRQAQELADTVVCSIFVNPTQFNDPADLEKYPRTEAHDKTLLEEAGCDVVFLPSVAEMYGPDEPWHFDLGGLEDLLEGASRPGHYQGVTQIVKKLLDIVQPHWALFGQKDYQQWLVIRYMVKKLGIATEIVRCPIEREAEGLAMSSRNVRLSGRGRHDALVLYQTLQWVKEQGKQVSPLELQAAALKKLRAAERVSPEYFVICEGETLREISEWPSDSQVSVVALVAAKVEEVRLIDNMIL